MKEPCSPRPPSSEITLGVQDRADRLPGALAFCLPEELQVVLADFHGELDATLGGNRHSAVGGKAQASVRVVAVAGEDRHAAAECFVQRHSNRVELVTVIVMRQPRHLLIGVGRELDHGLGAETVVFLAAGDQRLFEPGADAFARNQAQMA